MTLPTGEQVAIAHGDQRAVITEVGATLRTYVKGGIPVVEGFAAEERATGGRGQILFPWPNRLEPEPWTFAGRTGRAAVTDHATATGAHGLVRWRPFVVDSVNQNRCVLHQRLYPSPDYPFLLDLEVAYHLGTLGLTCTTTVTNIDHVPAPFAVGAHPYLAVTTPTIEGARLQVPARAYISTDARRLPLGEILPVMNGPLDFREAKSINGHELNLTFTELERDAQGMASSFLTDSHDGTVELSVDRNFPYLQVYTGDQLETGRRRTSVAVEPMTAPPNALRSGKDLIVLEPGQRWAGSWRVRRW
jgi:aldose 1-epimerase